MKFDPHSGKGLSGMGDGGGGGSGGGGGDAGGDGEKITDSKI